MKDGLNILTGCQAYCLADQFHREDGPAIEYANGDCYWYQYGELHRTDGPAIDRNGFQLWYYRGQRIPVTSQEEYSRWLKLKAFW
jgi:hypothetical protein